MNDSFSSLPIPEELREKYCYYIEKCNMNKNIVDFYIFKIGFEAFEDKVKAGILKIPTEDVKGLIVWG